MTVLSNEEVIYQDEQAQLFYIRYDAEGGDGASITIATQRPETIFADVAICVNPKDPRYTDLVGKMVLIPLIDRAIPVIADDYVDMEFGTGALKITPAHDPNDYEIGQRYNLAVIDTIDDNGKINDLCTYQPIVGLDRFDARKRMKPALEESGHLVRLEDYRTNIGRSERTGAVVEPKLSLQWFVKMAELREPAVRCVEDQDVRFYPDSMKNMYRSWMDGLRDWCISRQLWWGHRIPAWYLVSEQRGKETHIFVANSADEALNIARKETGRPDLTMSDLRQDEDVLDTWASSWLWPISVFDGFNSPDGEFKYYYPTNVLVTAPEIIFFWVARMIMAGFEFVGEKPFSHVYFTGIVRDSKRRKMSKSLGNSPDPLDIIAEYGADSVRYGMLSSASAGNDILFDMKMVENGRNFCNKMWNALRLVKGWEVTESAENEETARKNALAVAWMREKIKQTLVDLDSNFQSFRLNEALMTVYALIWDDFCSWYLEMIKPAYEKPIDQATLDATVEIFSDLTVILHPFMPFITEEIWHQLKTRAAGDDCVIHPYPTAGTPDKALIQTVESAKDVIAKIRDLRNQNQIKPREELAVSVQNSDSSRALYAREGLREMVVKLAVLSSLDGTDTEIAGSKSFVSGTEQYYVALEQTIDVEAERKKMTEELGYQRGFVQSVRAKLSNERFVAGAPAQVVETERKKLADGEARIVMLEEMLGKL
jgi:valyl-tRNA synthetase